MVDLLNRERVAANVDPLPRASGLDQLAFNLAMEGYAGGRIEVREGEDLRNLLNDAGMPGIDAVHTAVLAAGPESAHAALIGGDARLSVPSHKRVGVAVVKGPVGLLVIQILEG